jgi:uncharacterized membrane protein
MNTSNIRALILIGLWTASIITAVLVYPHIQYPAVSHWNTEGVPDGFILPFWAAAFGPLTIGILLLLWWGLPKIDPLKKNISSFKNTYDNVWIITVVFMFYLYSLSLYWNTGNTFNMNRALGPAMGALFIALGLMLPKIKRNWFMGIRTPWTLASDVVWKKTHALSGTLFLASGIIALFSFIFPEFLLPLVLIPIIASSVVAVVYSYTAHKNQTHE